jgi:hypothetical protein
MFRSGAVLKGSPEPKRPRKIRRIPSAVLSSRRLCANDARLVAASSGSKCSSTPQRIERIHLVFRETERERTQEFSLRWWAASGSSGREAVRQQFNFSPAGATEEVEEYRLDLTDVIGLELRIVPDISGGNESVASLAELQLA